MQADAWEKKAARYTAVRWVGVLLFCVAAPALVAGIAAWATGRAAGGLLAPSLFAVGLSLGTFGTNDDAALHAFAELDRRGLLPARFRTEWDAERKRRPARANSTHDHPTASLVLPLLAASALGFVLYRLGIAWSATS